MENEFVEQALVILRKYIPNVEFKISGDIILAKKNDKILQIKVDFEKFFELIDNDLLLRQQDSRKFYYEQLCKAIEEELNNFNN